MSTTGFPILAHLDHGSTVLGALPAGDTSLDRLGRSTRKMFAFADELRSRGAGPRVLNPDGGHIVAINANCEAMLFTIVAALEQMEHESPTPLTPLGFGGYWVSLTR